MRDRNRGAGSLALRILLFVVALLVLVNGVVLLCETDPKEFYANLFHGNAASDSAEP